MLSKLAQYKNRHPYVQSSSATGINYYQYIDKPIKQHIYGDNYNFDYKEDYDSEYNTTIIFLGDKTECMTIKITDEDKTTAYIQSYKNFNIDDLEPTLFMKTCLKYLQNKLVTRVITTDNAMLYLSNNKIFICILYLLQHGGNYYIDNYGFEYVKNSIKLLYNKNKLLLKNHYYNKSDIIRFMSKKYKTDIIDRFVATMKHDELVMDWVKTYKPVPELYDIYADCIKYFFSQLPYTLLQGEQLQKTF